MKKNQDGLTEKEFLAGYKPGNYERPSVTVDMLIFTIRDNELQVLLIKRKNHPFIDSWAVPGGFVGIDESLEAAAQRELKEETGISGIYMEQLYTYGKPGRDPRMRVISVSYIALVPEENLVPVAGDDAKDAAWFSVKTADLKRTDKGMNYSLILADKARKVTIEYDVEKKYSTNGIIRKEDMNISPKKGCRNRMAFDHSKIIADALDRIKNKVEYTPIAFNLVNEEFTLPELQRVYEIILGKDLFKATFRKQMKKYVAEINKKKHVDGVVRDAKLYRYKEE